MVSSAHVVVGTQRGLSAPRRASGVGASVRGLSSVDAWADDSHPKHRACGVGPFRDAYRPQTGPPARPVPIHFWVGPLSDAYRPQTGPPRSRARADDEPTPGPRPRSLSSVPTDHATHAQLTTALSAIDARCARRTTNDPHYEPLARVPPAYARAAPTPRRARTSPATPIATNTAIAAIASGEPRSSSEPPSAV